MEKRAFGSPSTKGANFNYREKWSTNKLNEYKYRVLIEWLKSFIQFFFFFHFFFFHFDLEYFNNTLDNQKPQDRQRNTTECQEAIKKSHII